MIIMLFIICYVPEDSNAHYLMDKQLAHYFPSWEVYFDSSNCGFRTSQGCLDLLNWYVDLEARFEIRLSRLLGLRYKNHYLGDYNEHISNHYFQPFFQFKENSRLIFSITTHYYKGEDELGIGYFYGKNYLNCLETFFTAEDFDRNFSLQNDPEGPNKVIYKNFKYPFKLKTTVNKNWQTGRLYMNFDIGMRYLLESTDEIVSYREQGFNRQFNLRFWQDVKNFRIGLIDNLKWCEKSFTDTTGTIMDSPFSEIILENIIEPMLALKIGKKWIPTLYLTYNRKTEEDTTFYERNVYAYLLDVEFYPGGNFVWHFGTQRQFYNNNKGRNFKERRINLGLEYRYKNVRFYLVEAMEGDFPTPKYLHNHTYVQLLLKL